MVPHKVNLINGHVFCKNKRTKFAPSSDAQDAQELIYLWYNDKMKAKLEAVRGPTSISTRFYTDAKAAF